MSTVRDVFSSNRHRRAIVILITFMLFSGLVTLHMTSQYEKKMSLHVLEETAQKMSSEMAGMVAHDAGQLRLIARMIGDLDRPDGHEALRLLRYYGRTGMFSGLRILLPSDHILFADGSRVPSGESFRFSRESLRGEFVSGIVPDIETGGHALLSAVPILHGGRVTALLFGVIRLEDLPKYWQPGTVLRSMTAVLLDSATGDVILDTTFGLVGRRAPFEKLNPERESREHLQAAFLGGKTGVTSLRTPKAEDVLLCAYTPVNINSWRLAVMVPKHIASEGTVQFRNVVFIFIASAIIGLFFYALWMFKVTYEEMGEEAKRLEMIEFVRNVEQHLFVGHSDRKNIREALRQVASLTSSVGAVFTAYESAYGQTETIVWVRRSQLEKIVRKVYQDNRIPDEAFVTQGAIMRNYERKRDAGGVLDEAEQMLYDAGIQKLIAVPIRGDAGRIIGTVSVLNPRRTKLAAMLLESVKLSFTLLIQNIRFMKEMSRLAERDALTGLYNRASFERIFRSHRDNFPSSLSVVYVDGNHLHEINNREGHEAGDRQIRAIADVLRETYGDDAAFRTGGDEFIALVRDAGEEAVRSATAAVQSRLAERGIFISAGVSTAYKPEDAPAAMREAERDMYRDKRRYYEKKGLDVAKRYQKGD